VAAAAAAVVEATAAVDATDTDERWSIHEITPPGATVRIGTPSDRAQLPGRLFCRPDAFVAYTVTESGISALWLTL
jgi:hypothetical protein